MIGLEISIDTKEATKLFIRFGQKFSPSVMLKLIGIKHLNWINANFRAGGLESQWKPLSPNTIAARRQGGGSGSAQTLRDKGELSQSFTIGHPKNIFVLDVNTIRVGTQVSYASYQHFGTGPYIIRPRNKKFLMFKTAQGVRFAREVHHPGLPQRRLLPSEVLAQQMAAGELDAYIKTSIEQAEAG